MKEGTYPRRRHDGSAFGESDAARAAFAGLPLGFVACVLFIKGDWSEFASSLGFPTWTTLLDPCLLCFSSMDNWFCFDGIHAQGVGWPLKMQADLDLACGVCEHWRVIPDRAAYIRVRAALFYDKRPQGAHGRALILDLAFLDLLRGDRLDTR